ncbi:hypothetical protein RWV98_15260 [Agathobaculum sp. NTUH-O15-33]|uniref:hypothetical protein n=1 Tax=Agathobaculum sp. NTUH-O15-33 TaxID=3079302 RepID=UPI002958B0D9|nr:hypothetical protein [Agathobaculum sp. NTUH-O15-33]WNX83924.1 hypothetical protein RWV98_15260 [Agathobaculum sp. NTUH-O15-33]
MDTAERDALHRVREGEWAHCRANAHYFIETYCHIEDKDAAEIIQPFRLWPMQREALSEILSNRLTIILKARQLGITWLALSAALHELLFCEGHTCIALSRTEEEAKELVRRLWAVELKNMPELVREDGAANWGGPTYSHTVLSVTITFPSGQKSAFRAFASAGGAGRSFTANLLLLDEWAFQENAREIWLSAYPTINRPTGGRVLGLSTIERGTLFEELYTEDNGFHKLFIPWYADPRRDAAWYEQTRRDLGDLIMQEYPATPEEALTIPGGAFFPEVKRHTHVRAAPDMEGWRRYVCIDYGLDMFSAHWVAVSPENRAAVYREFDAPDLTIGEAAAKLRELSAGERIEQMLAPPDLWSRSQESGKSRAAIFAEHGAVLTKTSNDLPAGCAAIKEWLRDGGLTLCEGAAENLFRCLSRIQRDKARPNVYAKEPHALTHDVDSLRCFCVYWTHPAEAPRAAGVTWTRDQYDDYENAGEAGRAYLIRKWGEPVW